MRVIFLLPLVVGWGEVVSWRRRGSTRHGHVTVPIPFVSQITHFSEEVQAAGADVDEIVQVRHVAQR